MKAISRPSQFICMLATKGGQEQFQLSHHCSALAFVRLFVAAAAAAAHHESHFLGTEGQ